MAKESWNEQPLFELPDHSDLSVVIDDVAQVGWRSVLKSVLDRVLAGILLVLLAPSMAVIIVAIRMTSPGPAVVFHTRVGRYGRTFRLAKFRTVELAASSDSGQEEVGRSPRSEAGQMMSESEMGTTRVGRFLRYSGLDELPQLLNVLRGEMSLVGPRPRLPREVPADRDFLRLLLVRPGMTGLAQLQEPRAEEGDDLRPRLDEAYIDAWSPGLDVAIMWRTVIDLFSRADAEGLDLVNTALDERPEWHEQRGHKKVSSVESHCRFH